MTKQQIQREVSRLKDLQKKLKFDILAYKAQGKDSGITEEYLKKGVRTNEWIVRKLKNMVKWYQVESKKVEV